MFFFQWDESDWRQQATIMVYAILSLAGIIYMIVTAAGVKAFLGGTADVGGALFAFALATEGVIWNMVMAFGKLREAKEKGIEIGQERTIQAMRNSGYSEADIQKILNDLRTGSNGKNQS